MSNEDIAIKVDNVSKNFILPHEKSSTVKGLFTSVLKLHKAGQDTQHALRNISFEVKRGEFFGIVGRNGSGKSTMLKILAGIYQPTSGGITTNGKLVPFIELGVGFNPELTGRENVYLNGALLGFSKSQITAMYDEIVAFAELKNFMDQKLKNYSSGMQVRLAFSMATRAEADILLVDEVLAVGDADFQKKCFRYFRDLKEQKKTVVFVSHDMNAVQEYCDRAVLIEDSRLVVEGSSFDVGNAYTRMFLDKAMADHESNDAKRWGDGVVAYDKVSITPTQLNDNDAIMTLTTTVKVKEDVPKAVFGFKIRAEDDTSLLGSNTQLKKQTFANLKKGQKIEITWNFPNIFNSGLYFVDLAAQSSNYEVMHDSWEGVCSFKVERSEENSYPVHPPIEVAVKADGS